MGKRDLERARCDRSLIGLTNEWGRDQRGIRQRFRHVGAAELDGDEHGFDKTQAEAALFDRNQQAGQPHRDETVPDRGIAAVAGVEPAQYFGAVLGSQIVAHRVAQFDLVGGGAKIHLRPLSRQAEQTLGDDVALDLVRTGIDRAGQREDIAFQPAIGFAAGQCAQLRGGA
jgi:hypothetical protein